ncbi:uncharacterized protein LY89DRAFT_731765 [Mollisia scopiformis]|uniref:Uncharacterized protein n=1 Tax=Mollisia scopiformis TaxID=149040 RepID=A0A194XGV7_MOLSC|nr:uncharacterized protein LY89DRAFT_731765 [Mollisia scopiformis]KUJ19364.1 hypothetical protein LY89DRAFT_731765 [Mollisia scopiformis]
MCVTWLHVHHCGHSEKHEHNCYPSLLQRECYEEYVCKNLHTGISCWMCARRLRRQVLRLKDPSEQEEVRVSLDSNMEEHARLEAVVKKWREAAAGTLSNSDQPSETREDGNQRWTYSNRAFTSSPEWKDAVAKVVADEIGSDEDEEFENEESDDDEFAVKKPDTPLKQLENSTAIIKKMPGVMKSIEDNTATIKDMQDVKKLVADNTTAIKELSGAVKGWLEEEAREEAQTAHVMKKPRLS